MLLGALVVGDTYLCCKCKRKISLIKKYRFEISWICRSSAAARPEVTQRRPYTAHGVRDPRCPRSRDRTRTFSGVLSTERSARGAPLCNSELASLVREDREIADAPSSLNGARQECDARVTSDKSGGASNRRRVVTERDRKRGRERKR